MINELIKQLVKLQNEAVDNHDNIKEMNSYKSFLRGKVEAYTRAIYAVKQVEHNYKESLGGK
jgi:hypothetical protein